MTRQIQDARRKNLTKNGISAALIANDQEVATLNVSLKSTNTKVSKSTQMTRPPYFNNTSSTTSSFCSKICAHFPIFCTGYKERVNAHVCTCIFVFHSERSLRLSQENLCTRANFIACARAEKNPSRARSFPSSTWISRKQQHKARISDDDDSIARAVSSFGSMHGASS